MTNDYLQRLSEFENAFLMETKGSGSLSPFTITITESEEGAPAIADESYLGYDIHPENLESLFFDGLKLPRWESIEASTAAEQMEIYQQSFDQIKSDFPMISRISDTDQKVFYTPEEAARLQSECETVLDNSEELKTIASALKLFIACCKAKERGTGVLLIPN